MQISKYIFIISLSTSVWAENPWKEKKINFAQHTQKLHQRKINKLKLKPKYIQYKQKLNLKKSQLRWTFLENRLQKNHREKAQQLFNLFINPNNNKKSSKENL